MRLTPVFGCTISADFHHSFVRLRSNRRPFSQLQGSDGERKNENLRNEGNEGAMHEVDLPGTTYSIFAGRFSIAGTALRCTSIADGFIFRPAVTGTGRAP